MTKSEFEKLIESTDVAFKDSDIYKNYPDSRKNWKYSICGTKIEKNQPLIVGLNWGVGLNEFGKSNEFKIQTWEEYKKLPTFSEQINMKGWLGSFKRIEAYLNKYITRIDLSKVGYTNLCFFRSKSSYQLSKKDLDLSKNVFLEFLQIAEPSMILGFSTRLLDILSNEIKNDEKVWLPSRTPKGRQVNILLSIKGSYQNKSIFLLPHPNRPLKGPDRDNCWDFCFK